MIQRVYIRECILSWIIFTLRVAYYFPVYIIYQIKSLDKVMYFVHSALKMVSTGILGQTFKHVTIVYGNTTSPRPPKIYKGRSRASWIGCLQPGLQWQDQLRKRGYKWVFLTLTKNEPIPRTYNASTCACHRSNAVIAISSFESPYYRSSI